VGGAGPMVRLPCLPACLPAWPPPLSPLSPPDLLSDYNNCIRIALKGVPTTVSLQIAIGAR
jgi:hypothetical protein